MADRQREDWSALAPIGVEAYYLSETDSTNRKASLWALENTDRQRPFWVIAGRQTAGRGRRGRTWISTANNFYGSYAFWAQQGADYHLLPFVAGLAVHQALLDMNMPAAELKLKWPNDILCQALKLGGILIEIEQKGAERLFIIGVGINIMEAPKGLDYETTALCEHMVSPPSLAQFFKILAQCFEHYLSFFSQKMAPEYGQIDHAARVPPSIGAKDLVILDDWRRRAWGFGEYHHVQIEDKRALAKLVCLEDDGALLIELDAGVQKRLYAGDIFPIHGVTDQSVRRADNF